MVKKILKLSAAIAAGLLLLLAVCLSLRLHRTWLSNNQAPCEAAFQAEIYRKDYPISDEARTLISDYRRGWRELCSGKSERLSTLWAQALEIEHALSPISYWGFDDDTITSNTPGLRDLWEIALGRDFQSYVGEVLPLFVPAFKGGSHYGAYGLFFRRCPKLFASEMNRGNDEDKIFFNNFPERSEEFDFSKLYIRDIGPMDWCTKFGQFDWINEFQTLDRLSNSIVFPAYRESLDQVRRALENVFLGGQVCTDAENEGKLICEPFKIDYLCPCNEAIEVKDVLRDYQSVLNYFVQKNESPQKVQLLKDALYRLDSGKIQKRCSH